MSARDFEPGPNYCSWQFCICDRKGSGRESLTPYLAKSLGPRRITANLVAPGASQTERCIFQLCGLRRFRR